MSDHRPGAKAHGDAFAGVYADDDSPLARDMIANERTLRELEEADFPLPGRTRVITVANQKGGVGKTTTSVNIAAALAKRGATVLVIDSDPQGNASTAVGVTHTSGTPGVYEVMLDGRAISDVMIACPDLPTLWCVPATIDLAGADIELVNVMRREFRLADAVRAFLDERGSEFHYVIIDCPRASASSRSTRWSWPRRCSSPSSASTTRSRG